MSLLPLRRLGSLETATGDFNRWITRFEDQMETYETIGVELSEEAKQPQRFYLWGREIEFHGS